MSEEWCAAVDVARPHMFVALEVEDLVRCFGRLVCKVQQRYFGEGSCMAVASSVWCGGLLF